MTIVWSDIYLSMSWPVTYTERQRKRWMCKVIFIYIMTPIIYFITARQTFNYLRFHGWHHRKIVDIRLSKYCVTMHLLLICWRRGIDKHSCRIRAWGIIGVHWCCKASISLVALRDGFRWRQIRRPCSSHRSSIRFMSGDIRKAAAPPIHYWHARNHAWTRLCWVVHCHVGV